MSTSTAVHATPSKVRRPHRSAGVLLVLGGITFIAGGATHPGDSGTGSKISQLHEMLVDSMWYPSHALLLASFACFAAGILMIRRGSGIDGGMATVLRVVSIVAVVATLGMVFHLFAALGADGIADGDTTFTYHVQQWNEMVVDAPWGLALAALAVAGGVTRTLGNRVTLGLGLVGGLAFALASATIAYTDRFDALFPVSSLLGIWAVVVGLMVLLRRS